jgi:hypothetical protein
MINIFTSASGLSKYYIPELVALKDISPLLTAGLCKKKKRFRSVFKA